MSAPNMLCLKVAALTHVGLRRNTNEDCVAVADQVFTDSMTTARCFTLRLDRAHACLIADGMGGHPAGEVASRIAIEHLRAAIPKAHASDGALLECIRTANEALFESMASHPERLGMGTTIAGIAVDAESVAVLNAGDSRVYQILNGKLEQLSIDDSDAVEVPFLSLMLPSRVLSQCLGGFADDDEVKPHIARMASRPGLTFLVCSDGLHDMLSDDGIASGLEADLAGSVNTMLKLALDAGGKDNVSIILARIEECSDDGTG